MTKEHKNFYYGLTKEEHDALMLEQSRPLTQAPIKRRSELQTDLEAGRRNLINEAIKFLK
jgi:hypothetical protein